MRQRKYAEAEPLLLESRRYLEAERGFHAARASGETLESLAELYAASGRPRQGRR